MSGTVNPLEMSDDDFLKMNTPPEVSEETPASPPAEETPAEVTSETPASTPPTEEPTQEGSDSVPGSEEPKDTPEPKTQDEEKPAATEPKLEGEKPPQADAGKAEEKKPEAPQTIDYKAAYEQVMAPFKANGKTIQLNNPEEVRTLLQMGANYTRKMQELAPHRKLLMTIENAGMSDDDINFAIDLVKRKDPAAIQKLLKDSGVDPTDIDTSADSTYKGGGHTVTDQEVAFKSALEDMKSTPEGLKTLQTIHNDWDQTSKEVVFASPEIMTIIREQQENGIYSVITAEIDRQKTLGKLPSSTPFLQAYKTVGDELHARNAFTDLVKPEAPAEEKPAPTPVATRAAVPKSPVTNNEKAAAASPTRSTPVTAKPSVDYLAMSDEEFEKVRTMNGRI